MFFFIACKEKCTPRFHGSTLGPLLFILYIINLNKSLRKLKAIHFTDIGTLYLDTNPSADHTFLIDSEVAQVQTCINRNKISLKLQKKPSM